MPVNDRAYLPQTKLDSKHSVLYDVTSHDSTIFLSPDNMVYLVRGIFIKLCAYG